MNYKNQVLLLVEVHNLISSSQHNKKPISLHFNRCNRTTRWRTCPVFVQKHSVCFYKNRSYEKSKHLRQLEFQTLSPEKTKMDFYLVVAFILFSKLQDLNFWDVFSQISHDLLKGHDFSKIYSYFTHWLRLK